MDDGNIPTGGLGTHIIIGLIATGLLIIAMFLYFTFWNTPNSSSITISNNGNQVINVLISSPNKSDSTTFTTLPTKRINPKTSVTLTSYPGTTLIIRGYIDGDVNSLTYCKLILGNAGTVSTGKIISDSITYTDLYVSNNSRDTYGISLQEGYNVPISISPNNINVDNSSDIFTCSGPIWYQYINSSNSIFPCPESLTSGNNCENPCPKIGGDYCKCEDKWSNLDYYYTFSAACPNCLITTCDDLNYSCSRNDINNHNPINYTVTFFPNLGSI